MRKAPQKTNRTGGQMRKLYESSAITPGINNPYSRYATHCIATLDVLTMYFDEDSEYVTIPKRLLEVPLFFGRRLARHLSPSEVAEIRSFREKMINNFNLEALRSELMADCGKTKISAIDYGC